ncbi:MAG: hypothetical protein K2H60_04115 [Muribaculaceae bacterium]|nr:hypothetical protein [Muribaculaceae bacterium]
MNKIAKMRFCDWALIVLTIVTLVSSIQLEATGSNSIMWVWLHILIATLFITLIGWHLFLHFKWRNWFNNLWRQKSPVTRWLGIFYFLTALSALVALCHWLVTYTHSTIGGIHGKIGFIFIALAIGHTVKRIKSPILTTKKPKK